MLAHKWDVVTMDYDCTSSKIYRLSRRYHQIGLRLLPSQIFVGSDVYFILRNPLDLHTKLQPWLCGREYSPRLVIAFAGFLSNLGRSSMMMSLEVLHFHCIVVNTTM